jgi:hypothetical protein
VAGASHVIGCPSANVKPNTGFPVHALGPHRAPAAVHVQARRRDPERSAACAGRLPEDQNRLTRRARRHGGGLGRRDVGLRDAFGLP